MQEYQQGSDDLLLCSLYLNVLLSCGLLPLSLHYTALYSTCHCQHIFFLIQVSSGSFFVPLLDDKSEDRQGRWGESRGVKHSRRGNREPEGQGFVPLCEIRANHSAIKSCQCDCTYALKIAYVTVEVCTLKHSQIFFGNFRGSR